MRETQAIRDEMSSATKLTIKDYIAKVSAIYEDDIQAASEGTSYEQDVQTYPSWNLNNVSSANMPAKPTGTYSTFCTETYASYKAGTLPMYEIPEGLVEYAPGVPTKLNQPCCIKFVNLAQTYAARHGGYKLRINDGLRKWANGTKKVSAHHSGSAIDVRATSKEMAKELLDLAYTIGFGGIACGRESENYFVHMDVGPNWRWDYNSSTLMKNGRKRYYYVDRYKDPSTPWNG